MTEIVVLHARLYEIALPLVQPFRISCGELTVRRSLIVELEDADGNLGYGESAPFEAPFYSSETTVSARSALVDILLPRIVSQPVSSSADLLAVLSDGVVGNNMARAGCETAWWDLRAVSAGMPLVDFVTERLRELAVPEHWIDRSDTVECGIALGIPDGRDMGELRRWVADAIERGYRRVKLKVMPGWDVEPIRATQDVLSDMGSDIPLTVDANGAYDFERDRSALRRLDELGLLYLEQPLRGDALWDLCTLSDELETPVCLDESLESDTVARQVIEMGGPDVWNVKIQRVGGLEEACRIYARAVRSGIRLWAGTMPETGLGAIAMLALGCHAGFVYPSDLEPSGRWYPPHTDLIELGMSADGTMVVPTVRPPLEFGYARRLVFEV
jgi:O-succinylbenzoate synthase